MKEIDLKPGLPVRYEGNREGLVNDWYLTREHKIIVQVEVPGRLSMNNVPLEKLEKK